MNFMLAFFIFDVTFSGNFSHYFSFNEKKRHKIKLCDVKFKTESCSVVLQVEQETKYYNEE